MLIFREGCEASPLPGPSAVGQAPCLLPCCGRTQAPPPSPEEEARQAYAEAVSDASD